MLLQSRRLLATLWTAAYQAPLSTGFSRKEYRSGLLCPASGDLPDPGIEPLSLTSPALQADSLPKRFSSPDGVSLSSWLDAHTSGKMKNNCRLKHNSSCSPKDHFQIAHSFQGIKGIYQKPTWACVCLFRLRPGQDMRTAGKQIKTLCLGPALAGSRGYPRDERWWREKTRETSLDRAKSARERAKERESDQTGVFAGSGNV